MLGGGSQGRPASAGDKGVSQSKNTGQLRQIVQHFFTKAALTIVSSRVILPHCLSQDSGQIRVNKWFNLNIDESDVLSKELALWAGFDIPDMMPPALVVEIYLDTAELARNQSLVIFDERGRRWDVAEAMTYVGELRGTSRIKQARKTRVVLERWTISLGDAESDPNSPSSPEGPNIYKRAIVFFRALYAHLRFMPAWKFSRRMAKQPATLNSLRPAYRILPGQADRHSVDPLCTPLYPTGDPTVETHIFPRTSTLVGPMTVEVTYRTNCDFRLDESEAYLSSQLMRMDDQYFQPSLGKNQTRRMTSTTMANEVGSLPINVSGKGLDNAVERNQAYGSLATFHYAGPPTASSPISALRTAQELASISPSEGFARNLPSSEPMSSSSRRSSRSDDAAPAFHRKTSIPFQPFKAGSLSSSPARGIGSSPLSGVPFPRTSTLGDALAKSRIPSAGSLQSTSVKPSLALTTELPSAPLDATSPKTAPLTRYSSSFGNRRTRTSFTGITAIGASTSRSEEDNTSSGRPSPASSTQPGSGLVPASGGGSSGNIATDDDNISDFLKLLEQKKDLKSFNRRDEAFKDASAKRTTAALSKYRGLRDSHSALTESLSTSLMLHRSSSSSSRQLSGIPPTLVGASVSTSSPPGKAMSPHTPHTPAIPSRLSANATIDDDIESELNGSRPRSSRERSRRREEQTPVRSSGRGSSAIDIPTSPQRYPHVRRSSSANQHPRALEEEFGMRSASLPVEERPELSMSEILALQQPLARNVATAQANAVEPVSGTRSRVVPMHRKVSSSTDSTDVPRASGSVGGFGVAQQNYASRCGRNLAGRGSSSSFGTGSGMSDRPSRYGFSARAAALDDDEPLLFTMSELGSQSRKSLEEGRGGGGGARRR